MRAIPPGKRLQVARLYFSGVPYDEIALKTQVSKGSVVAIASELREGRFPELEDLREEVEVLREVAARLHKDELTPAEALLGLTLYGRLVREVGVEPQLLEPWIKLSQKLSMPDYPVQKVTGAAVKLMQLEAIVGLPFEQALADLEDKLSQLPQLNASIGELESKRLMLEKQIMHAEEQLRSLQSQKEALRKGKERLERLGAEHVDKLAEFVDEFEALGYNAEQVKKLASLKKRLPQLESRLQALGTEISGAEERKKFLLGEIGSISDIKQVLERRATSMPCGYCGWPAHLPLPRRADVTQGLRFYATCAYGHPNWFDGRDVIASVGWAALPS